MTTVSEAIEVMGIVAACHYRTAPRMDDREAVMVTAKIWADLFNVHRLELPDLKAAVLKRAAGGAADAPEPAEIITAARAIRRDRAERETREERQAREDAWDAELLARNKSLLAALINPVAAVKGITTIKGETA